MTSAGGPPPRADGRPEAGGGGMTHIKKGRGFCVLVQPPYAFERLESIHSQVRIGLASSIHTSQLLLLSYH